MINILVIIIFYKAVSFIKVNLSDISIDLLFNFCIIQIIKYFLED
jgi:hypothetical protein